MPYTPPDTPWEDLPSETTPVTSAWLAQVDLWLTRLSKIPPGGTAGQVLSKATDNDYDFVWADAATGDGGTDPGTPGAPSVSAGANATLSAGGTFTRTATESANPSITSRSWKVQSGPLGVGTTIGTAAQLSWRPGSSPAGTTDLRYPTFQEMAFELTSTAENSTTDWTGVYDYIQDIDDDRGYTAGIVGFTSATGDMLELVQHYVAIKPSGNSLAGYVDELTTLANEGMNGNAGNRADQLLGSAFRSAWANAANNDPLFREAQRDLRDSNYWLPAYNQAVEDGVGPLGLAILYDISVNHGPGEDEESFGGIVETAQGNANPPSDGGDEEDYLNALVDAREAVLEDWGDNQPDGRVAAHRSLINGDKFALSGNITWSMYGDNFSFNRPSPPNDAVTGTYVLRYSATNSNGTGTDDVQLTVS